MSFAAGAAGGAAGGTSRRHRVSAPIAGARNTAKAGKKFFDFRGLAIRTFDPVG
jgi:hypothetical protein